MSSTSDVVNGGLLLVRSDGGIVDRAILTANSSNFIFESQLSISPAFVLGAISTGLEKDDGDERELERKFARCNVSMDASTVKTERGQTRSDVSSSSVDSSGRLGMSILSYPREDEYDHVAADACNSAGVGAVVLFNAIAVCSPCNGSLSSPNAAAPLSRHDSFSLSRASIFPLHSVLLKK